MVLHQPRWLITLHETGHSIKSIARTLGISKNTVKSYIIRLSTGPLPVKELLALEDPLLESKFHAGNPAYKDSRFEHMSTHLDYYIAELKCVGVTKKLLWEEYKAAQQAGYGYSQFCFHLHQQTVARKPGMKLDHPAADKLFIDFAGKPLHYINRITGELIPCQVFVATLPFSDYSFAIAVPSQCVADFLYAPRCCINEFGGTPAVLVPDNFKSAIVKADRYQPDINRALEDFANHYNMTVIPARPLSLKTKLL